jgi:two-component system NtrC family sensor kinase
MQNRANPPTPAANPEKTGYGFIVSGAVFVILSGMICYGVAIKADIAFVAMIVGTLGVAGAFIVYIAYRHRVIITDLQHSIASLTDEIEARKVADIAAGRMCTRLRNIVDSMPSILIAVDTQGRVKQWNNQAQTFTGTYAEDAVGMVVTDALPLLKDHQSWIFKTIAERKSHTIPTIVLSGPDAKTRHFEVTVYPFPEGNRDGAVIRVDDITEKSRMEMMMVQTEKMMSVSGMAAGMAHEINNPLGIILQAARNMSRRIAPDFPKNQEVAQQCGVDLVKMSAYLTERNIMGYIEGIVSSVNRASAIVSNMLQFSRPSIETKAPSDLSTMINQAIELAANDYDLRKKFDFRSIEIIRGLDTTLDSISCVATEIEQVILNILKNAAQAMGERTGRNDPPRIWIRTRKETCVVRIEIEDNGPGIKDDVKTHIFEPFFTTKETGVGTGLGLSVSYFIVVKNHKGSIELETLYGKGTKFIIRLPLA